MKSIIVKASTSYEVIVGRNLISQAGEYIKKVTKAEKVAVITDDNVDKYYSEIVCKSLVSSGFSVCKFVFKHGEEQKSIATLNSIYSFLVENEITRSDCLIALGGGVVGDITGYASATYLRGIDFIQIPTSLLAQVDSSVGGKTAIDLPEGKNLVGAFKQPKLVLCDTDTLKSLPDKYFYDGMGEVIKYGMIKNKKLFDLLLNNDIKSDEKILDDVICECISIKRDVVEADEFEKGDRMLLNFGHTFAHAIEKATNYTGISHGYAVGIGMCLITQMAEKNGLCDAQTVNKLKKCLIKYSIPIETDLGIEKLAKLCFNDKKRSGGSINIVVCNKIGTSKVVKMTLDEFLKFSEI